MVKDTDIQAYIDGELEGAQRKRVLNSIEQNSQIRDRYRQLVRQKELLQLWWKSAKTH